MNRTAQMPLCFRPDNFLEELALMQHHGLPTRLLDWTESSLVALFFAVTGEPQENAVVWVLDARRVPGGPSTGLDANSLAVAARVDQVDVIHEFMAWLPRYVTPRLVAQRGCFTVHPLDSPKDLEAEGRRGRFLSRIEIPATAKAELEVELRVAGVNRMDLFPDLDGVAADMRGYLGDRFDPAAW